MILNHLWGLYADPEREWRLIERNNESLVTSISHILFIALIPCICSYIATVHIGWSIGNNELLKLTPQSALKIVMAMYVALVAAVFALAYLTYWMATTFGAAPRYSQALELSVYSATPMFILGFATLYPVLWLFMLASLGSIAYSVYLLYAGVPIIMNIPTERGFIYASSIVTCALVLLVAILTGSVILWSVGLEPQYLY
ncbi:MAG: Yip1 family protein [Ferrimonas sp.]